MILDRPTCLHKVADYTFSDARAREGRDGGSLYMPAGNTIITEQDYARFMAILEGLDREANAKFVFLLDKSGQQIASAGEMAEVDPTSLASLTAGNVAATEGVAQLVGEEGFTVSRRQARQPAHQRGRQPHDPARRLRRPLLARSRPAACRAVHAAARFDRPRYGTA